VKRFSIIHVICAVFPSHQGTQAYIRELCEALHQRSHKVLVLCYFLGGSQSYSFKVERIPDLPRFHSFSSGPYWQKPFLDLGISIRLCWLVSRFRPDFIHAHGPEAVFASLAAKKIFGLPLIYHAHSLFETELPSYFKGLPKIIGRFIDKKAVSLSDLTITISKRTADYLKENTPSAFKIVYLKPSFHLSEIKAEREVTRQRYGFSKKEVILYAGNLDSYQRIDILEKAFEIIKDKRPQAILVVITGSEAKKLKEKQGIWIFPHLHIKEVRKMMQAADVLVCPRTDPYGFPIKLLNYMLAGQPIVGFRSSGHELEHKRHAILIDKEDPFALAQGIELILTNPHLSNHLKKEIQKKVKEYSWENGIRELEDIYSRVKALTL
jgi:glycosyltransferase involved in cell wall biosynthesis